MADTKYTALTQIAPKGSSIFAIADAASSFGATVSSVVTAGSTQINAFTTSRTLDEGVLFNNAGVISSDALLEYHYSTQILHLQGTSTQVWTTHNPAKPVAPPNSTVAYYGKQIAGNMKSIVMGPEGIEIPLQPSLFAQAITFYVPTNAAAGHWHNTSTYGVGTFSTGLPQPSNIYTNTRRGIYITSSVTANLQAGTGGNENMFTRSSTAGLGGFFFFARVGVDLYASSTRYFVGLTDRSIIDICTSNTNTYLNTLAFVIQANTTSWGFYHSSTGTGTTEVIAGQSSLANATTNGVGYDFYIYCPPNTTTVYYRMDEFITASTLVNSSVTNHLPNVTSYMHAAAMTGNLNTSNGAGRLAVVNIYCETDT